MNHLQATILNSNLTREQLTQALDERDRELRMMERLCQMPTCVGDD